MFSLNDEKRVISLINKDHLPIHKKAIKNSVYVHWKAKNSLCQTPMDR